MYVAGHEEREWMYVLHSASNPFHELNEAILNVFYGDFEKGTADLSVLRAYCFLSFVPSIYEGAFL